MAGTYRITSDGVLGPSGKAVKVYSIIVMSGGTAAVVGVYNGSAATTAYDQIDGTVSKAVVRDYGSQGMMFPGGCYIDLDGNTTYVVASLDVMQ